MCSSDLGFGEEVQYRLVDPGPLAFADASFDVVFSKDAIIHVPDKEALYADALRVLRPGGQLLIGDWLRRDGDAVDAAARAFEDRSGGDFVLISLPDLAALVAQAGFVEIETEDRGAWYLEQVTDELKRLRGEFRDRLVAGWGDDDVANGTDFWEFLVKSVTIGALSPGHLRARKPPA